MLFNLAYMAAILLASPLLLYRALAHGKYRHGWQAKFFGQVRVPPPSGTRVWLHAVSVGEVNLVAALAERLRERDAELDLVISTTTATGYELALKRFPPDRVFYCPLDFTWAVRRALREIRPDALVLAELELWPNLIRLARHRGVPVAVINGRLSDASHRGYRRVRRLVAPTFARLSLVAAQGQTYADRFADLGTDPAAVRVTGSTKFDDAPRCRDTAAIAHLRRLIAAGDDHAVFMAGSTQAGEETVVLRVFATLANQFPHLRLIIIPRHAERFAAVATEIERAGFECRRRSTLDEGADRWDQRTVVLVDSIGELRSWWGLACVAFVGGSLGNRGGQNMLEPAGYGAAVCFGPNTRNFRDIVAELLAADAARVIHGAGSLRDFVDEMLRDRQAADRMGKAAQAVIAKHQGATDRTIDHLLAILPPRGRGFQPQ